MFDDFISSKTEKLEEDRPKDIDSKNQIVL